MYPVKALRGISLDSTKLGPQGIQYDRRFMLCRVSDAGELSKIQLSGNPECSLFAQDIVDDHIHIRYMTPKKRLVPEDPLQETTLEIPLEPDTSELHRSDLNLHQSKVWAYRVGEQYDAWFTACFGFPVALLYIGEKRRPVLGTFSPRGVTDSAKGWLSSVSSYVMGGEPEPDWLAFSDFAPYLVATDTSLNNVRKRLSSGDVDMLKFRPNIVVSGEGEWDEDYWAELDLNGESAILLTKLCNRCSSVNVDYDTGKVAEGERGTVLKKLMSDRRVDKGFSWSACFGRYGFLADGIESLDIAIGDEMNVVRRTEERPVFDWPIKRESPGRYYNYK